VQRQSILLVGLVGAVVLYLLSRTQRGQQVASDAVGAIVNAALPRGLRNNNPGNLRYIARNPWNGQVGDDGEGYGVYSSMALGVRAAGRQLLAYQQRGIDTVREIISTWAPANENDTDAYVRAVASRLHVGTDQRINVASLLEPLAEAIFRHEVGVVAFAASRELTRDNIRQWVRA
jgi:hypothetical protein